MEDSREAEKELAMEHRRRLRAAELIREGEAGRFTGASGEVPGVGVFFNGLLLAPARGGP